MSSNGAQKGHSMRLLRRQEEDTDAMELAKR